MIPIKLELKNFLSYGPQLQTVNFGPYPLICLSGKNGHGKSALLDAMTWAIWGQARKSSSVAKADAQLVHLGQTQMLVCFEFYFNGHHYRIKREFAKTYGKPVANLDFGIIDPDTNAYNSLTDKTIRATQEKIETTIGLSYDAFINSAFLKQGQSNEFSQKSPKERKEVLGSILGLNQYEELRKKSLEKSKEFAVKKASLKQRFEAINAELTKKESYQIELATAHNNLNTLQQELAQAEAHKDALTKKYSAITEQELKQQAALTQYKELSDQEQVVRNELGTLIAHWRKHQKLLTFAHNKKELEDSMRSYVQKIAVHQQKLTAHLKLKESLLATKETLHKAESAFEERYRTAIAQLELKKNNHEKMKAGYYAECQQLLKQIKQAHLSTQDIQKKITALQQTLPKQPLDPAAITQQELLFEKRKSFYHSWIAQANAIKNTLEQLQHKKNLTDDSSQPSCPLCEQNLSASRKKFLQTKFLDEYQHLNHQIGRFKRIISNLKEVLLTQHKELEAHKKIATETALTVTNIKQLSEQLTLQNAALKKFEQEQTALLQQGDQEDKLCQDIHKHLLLLEKEKPTARAKDAALSALMQQQQTIIQHSTALNYQTDLHQEDQRILDELQKKVEQLHHLDTIVAEQDASYRSIKQLSAQRKTIRIKQRDAHILYTSFASLAESKKQSEQELAQSAQAISMLQKNKEALLLTIGRINAQLEALEKIEREAQSFLTEESKLSQEQHAYEIIAQAMGKDGIQALLIEQAIPEIEQEANDLLAQLTDNQSHIIIDSLRDLKKGGTKETLDIKISDSAGIRPYELFSGGEAFRIDFALRIAISKLLARRSGTSLQTLIIDEGFGSQDEEGLQHIMDALVKIQNNFSKVIIVSHLPSMKEQFPVHFFIEKKSAGSQITIFEEG